MKFELAIRGETFVRIVHNLIVAPGVRQSQIKRVYSHPVALNQCRTFFELHPQFERTPFYDTAGSVKMMMEDGLSDAGAIASAAAARIYGARILKKSIEDDRENYTRFFLLTRKGRRVKSQASPNSAKYKTSVVFTVGNRAGTLFKCLSAFALRDLNMTKIESRPLRGKPWEYLFYLDFIGHVEDPAARNALGHLTEVADTLRVLGCYPARALRFKRSATLRSMNALDGDTLLPDSATPAPDPVTPVDDPPVIQAEELPILAVRDTVLYPNALLPLSVGRPTSVALVESLGENRLIGVVSQTDPRTDSPGADQLHQTGTVAMIHKIVRMREGQLLFCEGIARMRTLEYTATEPFLRARIERLLEIEPEITPELTALRQNVLGEFTQIIAASPNISDEVSAAAGNITEIGRMADFIAGTLPSLSHTERQLVLEQADARQRLEYINQQLAREVELLELRQKIQSQVQGQLSQSQREFYLREQLKAIQKELGEGDDHEQEADDLRAKIEQAGMPEEVKAETLKELHRFSRINAMSPEHNVARTWLEWMIALPWSVSTGEAVNVQRAAEILDEDHYDLEKVKDRILDFLAVMQLKPKLKGPILCFVGPPGVGKTSLGRSIARALGRKFQRISMGGMHDEAEIRGHRRTYIGSLPGQIIQSLRRAGANDPVFILDEVDKLGRDFRGDPASALLEVLDPEQNATFRDNYLDQPFDLSRVLFITTANVLDTVPAALRDRMEVIDLQGYTEHEKVIIAFRYLIPRQQKENGLDESKSLTFTGDAVRFIVRRYTREAGVRNLEREIGTVCRKVARRYAEAKEPVTEVTPALVEEFLGAPRHRPDTEVAERTRRPGVAVGLAWTPVGGDVLFIEAGRMPGGSKGLIMTGQLGSVMQESVQAALTWVRANATRLAIDPDIFKTSDIHVHVPAGAIPKDGPSAGVTMATALLSMLTEKCVRQNLAMTGEITLTGQVLPVGGIKEKVLAAKRGGVTEIILPAENEANVREDLKAEQLGDLIIHYVTTMDQIIPLALA